VSAATVVEAYRLLERRGLIEARPQSGYYVRAAGYAMPPEPRPAEPADRSRPVDLSNLALEFTTRGHLEDVVRLGPAVPDMSLMPTVALGRHLSAAARRAPENLGYAMTPGVMRLRRLIAARMVDAGCALGPDDIMVTNGCTEAVYLALRAVTKPGDTVAVQTPTYYGLLETLQALSLRAIEIATHPADGIDLDHLESLIGPARVKACALVTNFCNPLGSCMPDDKKRALAALLARHDLPLVEDDIYGELVFEGRRPSAVKAYDAAGLVLYCSSFSKVLAPGLRVGWCAPGRYADAVAQHKLVTSMASGTTSQLAIADYLSQGSFDRHLRRLRRFCAQRVEQVRWAVARSFPEGTRISRPAGGHVVWVEMPGQVDSVALFQQAFAAGVSIAPGVMFSATGEYRNFIRLNCALPWSETLQRAIELVAERATSACPSSGAPAPAA